MSDRTISKHEYEGKSPQTWQQYQYTLKHIERLTELVEGIKQYAYDYEGKEYVEKVHKVSKILKGNP